MASGSHSSSNGKVKAPKMRRPHTSAGPSDKSNIALGMGEGVRMVPVPASSRWEQEREQEKHREWDGARVHRNSRESGLGESIASVAGQGQNRERERAREKEKEKERQAKMRERTPVGHDQVRAWEEELARIEVQSRRSSAHMLGSWGLPFGRRKSAAVLQRG